MLRSKKMLTNIGTHIFYLFYETEKLKSAYIKILTFVQAVSIKCTLF